MIVAGTAITLHHKHMNQDLDPDPDLDPGPFICFLSMFPKRKQPMAFLSNWFQTGIL